MIQKTSEYVELQWQGTRKPGLPVYLLLKYIAAKITVNHNTTGMFSTSLRNGALWIVYVLKMFRKSVFSGSPKHMRRNLIISIGASNSKNFSCCIIILHKALKKRLEKLLGIFVPFIFIHRINNQIRNKAQFKWRCFTENECWHSSGLHRWWLMLHLRK